MILCVVCGEHARRRARAVRSSTSSTIARSLSNEEPTAYEVFEERLEIGRCGFAGHVVLLHDLRGDLFDAFSLFERDPEARSDRIEGVVLPMSQIEDHELAVEGARVDRVGRTEALESGRL
jgi:hypothetical protein